MKKKLTVHQPEFKNDTGSANHNIVNNLALYTIGQFFFFFFFFFFF